MRKVWAILLPVLILGIAFLIATRLIATKPQTAPVIAAEKAWPVQVMLVEPGNFAPSLQLYGRVDALWSTRLTAAVEADVLAVEQITGDAVQAGQLLVRLDEQEATLRLQQAEADLAEAKARVAAETIRHTANQKALPREKRLLRLARNEVNRLQNLVAKQVTTQSALDTARQMEQQRAIALTSREQQIAEHKTRRAEVRARLDRAKAAVAQAALLVQRCRIVAPFNGVLTEQWVSPGQRVRSGEPLVQLYATDTLVIRAQIPNRYLATLRQAMAAGVTVSAWGRVDGQPVTAQLRNLGGVVASGRGGVEALFDLQDYPEGMPQGRFMPLTLSLPALEEVVAVPHTALYGTDRLYRLDAQNRLRAVSIAQVGERRLDQQPAQVLVRSEQLQAGMRIMVTQLPQAREGLLVRQARHESNDATVE